MKPKEIPGGAIIDSPVHGDGPQILEFKGGGRRYAESGATMAASVRAIDYVYVTVKERPGEAYRLLSELAEAGVNLLAFSAIPIGPGHTQLVLFPNKMERLVQVAEQLGLVLTGPQRAFLVQGDDRLGTIAEIQRKLLDRNIHAYASSGVTDGRGGFGYVLYVKPEDFEAAAHALEVEG